MDGTRKVAYPYARLKGLEEFMAFLQAPEWKPSKIDAALLKKLDVAKSKERETVHALEFLGIVNDDGAPTQEFDQLKADYRTTLRRLVLDKYRDLFDLIPPALVNQTRLVRFFGLSADTAEYQAKLFAWFCEQAGIDLPNLEKHFHRARFDKENNKN